MLSEVEKYTWDYAVLLRKHDKKQTFDELSDYLNSLGYRHKNGSVFHIGKRTTSKFINDLYWKIEPFMGADAAKPIAKSFTDANGEYAYDRGKPEVTQEWLDEQQASWPQPAD